MSEHKTQEYKGNGKHVWELVFIDGGFRVDRLRVPGAWLYRDMRTSTVTRVPVPEVTGHPI